MFMTGGVSFVLYSLLFLKLRGYVGSNFKFSFKPRPIDPAVNRVAHQMLWYPVSDYLLRLITREISQFALK